MLTGLFLLIGILLLTVKTYSQDSTFYIYLCFGQSNMEGQGAIEGTDQRVDPRFQVMEAVNCSNLGRTKGNWYTAVPPLTRCYSGLSPADYFGKTMIANLDTSISVGIVNVSVAGCKIELFQKDQYQDYVSTITEQWLLDIIAAYDGNPYAYLVEVARLAQQDGVIKGILLHQGESNTGDIDWPEKVKGIYDSLIVDLELDPDSVPLLAGEVVHADQGGICASVNAIIDLLPLTVPNSYVIPSSGATDASDNLHFNSAGYREMGIRYAKQMLLLYGYDTANIQYPVLPVPPIGTERMYFEAECSVVGEDWQILYDADASNEGYVMVDPTLESTVEAPADSAGAVYVTFTSHQSTNYNIFARLNCPTANDDSYWVKLDDGDFLMVNGLGTTGWQWLKLLEDSIGAGVHTLTIAYRENGAKLDKICITDFPDAPTTIGNNVLNCANIVGLNESASTEGYKLSQNYPNPFNENTSITFETPKTGYVSLKVYNMLGIEISELAGKEYNSGKHTVEFSSKNLVEGNYFYILKTDNFISERRMIFLTD
jgi:hypothetical protein